MRSTRNNSGATKMFCTLIASVGLAGCAAKVPPQPDPISHAPPVVDEAMQLRDWPITAAHYQDGSTPGWATTFIFINNPNTPTWTPAVTETPLFAFNSLICPIVLICSPPWQRIIYPSDGIEPSYNAMPPLPAK
jgi:hypothetical protein